MTESDANVSAQWHSVVYIYSNNIVQIHVEHLKNRRDRLTPKNFNVNRNCYSKHISPCQSSTILSPSLKSAINPANSG